MKVLINGTVFSNQDVEVLESNGLEVRTIESSPSKDDLIQSLKGVDIFVLAGNVFLDREIIEQCNLKLVAFYGSGYSSFMDVDNLKTKGIEIANTPGANSTSVAEHHVALILDAIRNITYLNNELRNGNWKSKESWNLKGKTLGVLGMGNIGSKVARIMHNGFDMNIIYLSRERKPRIEKEIKAKMVNLETLLKQSDVLSITASLNADTRELIGLEELKSMQNHAILVNTSNPGWIVSPNSLKKALVQSYIACAAYDSYYIEPVDKSTDKYGLLKLPENKFILTPHNAYNSQNSKENMKQMTIENIISFSKTGKPKFPISYKTD